MCKISLWSVVYFKLERSKFWLNLEFDQNTVSGTGARAWRSPGLLRGPQENIDHVPYNTTSWWWLLWTQIIICLSHCQYNDTWGYAYDKSRMFILPEIYCNWSTTLHIKWYRQRGLLPVSCTNIVISIGASIRCPESNEVILNILYTDVQATLLYAQLPKYSDLWIESQEWTRFREIWCRMDFRRFRLLCMFSIKYISPRFHAYRYNISAPVARRFCSFCFVFHIIISPLSHVYRYNISAPVAQRFCSSCFPYHTSVPCHMYIDTTYRHLWPDVFVRSVLFSMLRDFTRSCGKTSYRLVNRGPGSSGLLKDNYKTRREAFKFLGLVPLIIEIWQ